MYFQHYVDIFYSFWQIYNLGEQALETFVRFSFVYYCLSLTLKDQGFSHETTNPIDHIVKNIIQVGRDFIPLESVKEIVCVGQKINKLEKRSLHVTHSRL